MQEDITSEVIQLILNKFNLGRLTSTKKLYAGLINPSLLLNEMYVLRLGTNQKLKSIAGYENKFRREMFLMGLLPTFNIPVQKCFGLDTSKEIVPYEYIILSYLPGETIQDADKKIGKEFRSELFFQLGGILKKIHSVKMQDFGDEAYLFGSLDWKREREDEIARYISVVKAGEYLSLQTIDRVEEIFIRYKKLGNLKSVSRLVHGDFSKGNILVNNNSISGILDFEFSHIGDPLVDLEKLPSSYMLKNFDEEAFLKGFGVSGFSDEEKVRLTMYGLRQGLWEIWATKVQQFPFNDEHIQEGINVINNTLRSNL